MKKRIVFLFEEQLDDGTVDQISVSLGDGHTENLTTVLRAFVAFLQAMTFRVSKLVAQSGQYTHSSDDE